MSGIKNPVRNSIVYDFTIIIIVHESTCQLKDC